MLHRSKEVNDTKKMKNLAFVCTRKRSGEGKAYREKSACVHDLDVMII